MTQQELNKIRIIIAKLNSNAAILENRIRESLEEQATYRIVQAKCETWYCYDGQVQYAAGKETASYLALRELREVIRDAENQFKMEETNNDEPSRPNQ